MKHSLLFHLRHFSLLFLVSVSLPAMAQQLLHCGADEMRISTLKANPKIAKAVIERDAELEAFTREYALKHDREGGPVYVIPVVFHVIHKYGTGNISREQILDGLRILNETFRKTRADTADIRPEFQPLHADCGIEFHLATIDPDGNCHSGIDRIASSLTTVGDHSVKSLVHWDSSKYLNIYVVSNAAGLAGHSVWPADADTIPEWDGIVVTHSYVGSIGTSNPTRSVVLAHECGHYLNLQHIWGGNNVPGFYYLPVGQPSNCGEDDLVSDTPNTIGWSNCNLNAASCGNTVDNVQNAMDYSYCNIMFTEGQKTRMRAALNSTIAHRSNLWTNANLLATGVTEPAGLCAARFTSDRKVVCPNTDNEIHFLNTSYSGEIDSVRWTFQGGTPASTAASDPTVAYSQPGKYDVSLTAYDPTNSVSTAQHHYVTVLQDSSWNYPFSEGFEDGPSLDGPRWMSSSPDTDNNWELTDTAAFSGNWSAMVDNYGSPLLTVDELNGPPIDLSGTDQMKVSFRYAFTGMADATGSTKLQFQISHNCETNWSSRLNLSGTALQTSDPQTAPFVPTSSGQWVQAVVNVPSSYLEDGFRFRWLFRSEGNDRLYLDDVNIDVTAGTDDLRPIVPDLTLYPNPANDRTSVRFYLETASTLRFSVTGMLGRQMIGSKDIRFTSGRHAYELNTTNLGSGMYLLHIQTDKGTIARKLVIR